jgi:hypothetical protein
MASEMAHLRERCALGEIPEIDGVSPVVVTFHDTNDYTADHLAEYLAMLVDQAREMGFTLADKPYFDQPRQLENVALLRALGVVQRVSMVPWWWRWIEW